MMKVHIHVKPENFLKCVSLQSNVFEVQHTYFNIQYAN
jgi:hypothetical protein